MSETAFDGDDIDEIEREIQSLEDQLTDPLPDDFEDFTDDFEGPADHLLDADAFAGDVDGTYTLVHEPDDWSDSPAIGRLFHDHVPTIDSDVDDPRLETDPDTRVVISLWDATDDSWLQNTVDNSHPGATTDGTVVIEQLDPTGGTMDVTEHETRVIGTTGVGVIGNEKEHHAVETELPKGVYRTYPEGHPERGYIFTVGDPDDLAGAIQSDLEDTVVQLEDRSETIQDLVMDDTIVRERTTTNETGHYAVDMPDSVRTVNVQAYKGDSQVLDAIESITDPDDPELDTLSVSDFREARLNDYNGSFYLPAETRTYEPGESNADVEVVRADQLPHENIGRFGELAQWLEDEIMDTPSLPSPTIPDPDPERDVLEGVYETQRILIENSPDAEESYLNESDYDEIQDADDLSTDELETEIDLMQDALRDEASIGLPGDGDLEIEDGELHAEIDLPPGVDGDRISPELRWSDGEVEQINESYWSVESGMTTIVGSDTLVIDGYPIDEADPAAFDLRVAGVGDDGLFDGRFGGLNPSFEGTVPDVRAVDINTLSPGPDERVSMTFRAADDASVADVTSVEVRGPDGQPVSTTVEDDSARFHTAGTGEHTVYATVVSQSGDEFRKAFAVDALEQSRSDPPTIRAEQAVGGQQFALAGEGLQDAEISVDGDRMEVSAVVPEGEIPGSVHIKPDNALEGTTHEIDVSVLEGDHERQVSSNIETVVHLNSLQAGDDAAIWRGDPGWIRGDPLVAGGGTRHGEVLDRSDDGDWQGKAVIRSFTDADGTMALTIDEDPSRTAGWQHTVATTLPRPSFSIPFLSSVSLPAAGAAASTATVTVGFALFTRRRRAA